MSIKILRGEFYPDRNAYVAAGEPAIFHCHHYNSYLQAVLLDASSYIDGIETLLADSAQEIAHTQFKAFYGSNSLNEEERKKAVEDYFKFAGFGKIDLKGIDATGGVVETSSDHYGVAFKSKFGINKKPVSYFTCGYLAGAIEAIYDMELGSLEANQDLCIGKGDEISRFTIIRSNNRKNKLIASQQEGNYQLHSLIQPDTTKVDYTAIRQALTNMPLEGAENTGLIDAFGVLLTRHYANYYCNISYGFLDLFTTQMGIDQIEIAKELMTEAGHVCAFNTFGGIMQSNEWNAMIKPMLSSKEDWIHGITAVVNSFGWGFWEIQELTDEKIIMKITGGYEANAYLGRYKEKPSIPISFLASGGVAGLMNLVYVLDLPGRTPVTLDENLYREISNKPEFFKAKQLKCRALGDEFDLIEAVKG
ncbi:hypothetical protein JMN32_16920 [Fulvivirga sp. 29W222]|uniref:Uncharacterized protein n=1 Tax=Fulvivirga marina TaxID=2494733 RepID=A0A937G009_9BACT|nr:hypothetical protein [Fulvivirga marina]MBL6448002.1 hypothetical protein [Fulvivirga marina]